jgi:RNA-directed DNA polymerase
MHENREISGSPSPMAGLGRIGKAACLKPMMNEPEKSDRPVVPMKGPNKAGKPAAEAPEGRGLAKGNSLEQNTPRTQSRVGVPSALERVRQAEGFPGQRFRILRFDAITRGKSPVR